MTKNNSRLVCIFVFLVGASGLIAPAQGQTLFALTQPDLIEAPCGPDWARGPIRALIPQGAFGASFRSACLAHDACYETYGVPRRTCDRRYLNAMNRSCDSAWWPAGCRCVARFMYTSVRLFGGSGYRRGQKLAAKQKRCSSGSRARCRRCRWRK